MRALLAAAAVLALAAPALASEPFTILGVGYSWAPPAGAVRDGEPVQWRAAVFGHTVTTADSLEDALSGVGNEPPEGDADPDTFDVVLSREGAPFGEPYAHAFAEPGTTWFFCRYHWIAGMVGAVEVR